MKEKTKPGEPSWKAKSGAAAGALLATLVTLGGVALLFASASGEADHLAALLETAPSWAAALVVAPAHG